MGGISNGRGILVTLMPDLKIKVVKKPTSRSQNNGETVCRSFLCVLLIYIIFDRVRTKIALGLAVSV